MNCNASTRLGRWSFRAGLALLLALPTLLFLNPLKAGAIPNFMDPLMYFYPLRVAAARLLAAGEWPLWNRGLMGGMPLFENPQAALGYPLVWLFLKWPTGFWFTWPQLLELGLYGALTAWLVRRQGAPGLAAWWAGALAVAGGYGWSRLQFANYMHVLPWLPLWLGAAHAWATARRRNPLWLALGGVSIALMLLSGAHQLVAYAFAGFLIYALVQAVPTQRGTVALRLRWLWFGLATLAIGLLLGAPGWWPQLGFMKETARASGIDAKPILNGSIGSVSELLSDLVRNNLLAFKARPGAGPWADAEVSVGLGVAALVLAMLLPQGAARRRAWLGCWLAALVSIVIACRPFNAFLLGLSPKLGIFHGPFRALGMAQWWLLLAAGLGATRLWPGAAVEHQFNWRRAVYGANWLLALGVAVGLGYWWARTDLTYGGAQGGVAVGLLLIAALTGRAVLRLPRFVLLLAAPLLLGHLTWVTTDLKTRTLEGLANSPLLAQADLKPGERFFTLDWRREASYDYARPDLAQWALPNLAQLWGYEDLGGYEPAQSSQYREFMRKLHRPENWRQPYKEHFGLVQVPLARKGLDAANVRAALLPRWGVPAFFRPAQSGLQQAPFPKPMTGEFDVRALVLMNEPTTLTLAISRQGATSGAAASATQQELWRYDLSQWHAPTAADDVATSTPQHPWPVRGPELLPTVQLARLTLPPQFQQPEFWLLGHPPQVQLLDLFCWDAQLAELWAPRTAGEIAMLCDYRGTPAWISFEGAQGGLIDHSIRANRVECTVNVFGPPLAEAPAKKARLVIHDAYWRGWQAWVDGKAVKVKARGLWRGVPITLGEHHVVLEYRPKRVPQALWGAAGGGIIALLLSAWGLWRACKKRQ